MNTYIPMSVGSVALTRRRRANGSYVNGYWTDGAATESTIVANVQPLKGHELLMFPESYRSRASIKIYTSDSLRTLKEDEYPADDVQWEGEWWEVVKVQNWAMGVLNHTKAIAFRRELNQ